jgi:hypothetical protein
MVPFFNGAIRTVSETIHGSRKQMEKTKYNTAYYLSYPSFPTYLQTIRSGLPWYQQIIEPEPPCFVVLNSIDQQKCRITSVTYQIGCSKWISCIVFFAVMSLSSYILGLIATVVAMFAIDAYNRRQPIRQLYFRFSDGMYIGTTQEQALYHFEFPPSTLLEILPLFPE